MSIKQTLQRTMYKSVARLRQNTPTILTVVSVAGVIGTAVMAVKATPKAMELLKKSTDEKGEELTKVEAIKVAGPVYLPTIAIGVSTIACILGSNALSVKRQASLASAYALVSNSYQEYKEKLKELYGEEAHQKIVDSIVKEKVKDTYLYSNGLVSNNSLDLDEDDQAVRLFYDEYSGKYFESTLAKVIAAEYHFNRNFTGRGYSDINEWYEFLGLECDIDYDFIGWSVSKMLEDGLEFAWVDFNHRDVELDDGLHCCVIEMVWEPIVEYLDVV